MLPPRLADRRHCRVRRRGRARFVAGVVGARAHVRLVDRPRPDGRGRAANRRGDGRRAATTRSARRVRSRPTQSTPWATGAAGPSPRRPGVAAHPQPRVRRRRHPPSPPRHLPAARRRAPTADGRAGAAPDPRRRVDDRLEGAAGPAAHVPARAARLGLRRDQLPPLTAGDVARPSRSTASARWRG